MLPTGVWSNHNKTALLKESYSNSCRFKKENKIAAIGSMGDWGVCEFISPALEDEYMQ